MTNVTEACRRWLQIVQTGTYSNCFLNLQKVQLTNTV